MKTFDFLADQLPFGYAFNFDNYLFNKLKHINTQGVSDRADFFIVNNVKKRIEGKIHFLIKDGVAYSPYRSLFGSFEFNPRIHPNVLMDFWRFIEGDLRVRHIHVVHITAFAECYAPKKADLIHNTLTTAGFSISLKAINHHIPVNDSPLSPRMHGMEQRRLNKCRKAGFIFQQEASDKLEEIYHYLELCRAEQQLEVSLSLDKLRFYLEDFPQNYLLFTVRRDDEIMAATIAIIVHRKILYNFIPGSLHKYNAFSPTVMLCEGLYSYCQDRNIELLDLGISTEKDGKDQKSLIRFKERIGGERSYKYFYQRNLLV
ncbi:MAG: GNAT family N-acetyltransferase [Cyclobacteriaceae bacterium]|nr:GNAT family N-acetyltransferase [Cyclobacteriaceae bacterium]